MTNKFSGDISIQTTEGFMTSTRKPNYYANHTRLIAGDGAPIRCAPWTRTMSREALAMMYGGSFMPGDNFDLWEHRRARK